MKRLTVEKLIDLLSALSPSAPIKVLELEVRGDGWGNYKVKQITNLRVQNKEVIIEIGEIHHEVMLK